MKNFAIHFIETILFTAAIMFGYFAYLFIFVAPDLFYAIGEIIMALVCFGGGLFIVIHRHRKNKAAGGGL